MQTHSANATCTALQVVKFDRLYTGTQVDCANANAERKDKYGIISPGKQRCIDVRMPNMAGCQTSVTCGRANRARMPIRHMYGMADWLVPLMHQLMQLHDEYDNSNVLIPHTIRTRFSWCTALIDVSSLRLFVLCCV